MIFEQVEFQHDVLHMKEQQITKLDFKTLLQKLNRLKLSHSKMHVPWFQISWEPRLYLRQLRTEQDLIISVSFLKLQLYIHRLRFWVPQAFSKSRFQILFLSKGDLLWYGSITVNIHVIYQFDNNVLVTCLSWSLMLNYFTGAADCWGLFALNSQIRSSLSRRASPSSEYFLTNLSN